MTSIITSTRIFTEDQLVEMFLKSKTEYVSLIKERFVQHLTSDVVAEVKTVSQEEALQIWERDVRERGLTKAVYNFLRQNKDGSIHLDAYNGLLMDCRQEVPGSTTYYVRLALPLPNSLEKAPERLYVLVDDIEVALLENIYPSESDPRIHFGDNSFARIIADMSCNTSKDLDVLKESIRAVLATYGVPDITKEEMLASVDEFVQKLPGVRIQDPQVSVLNPPGTNILKFEITTSDFKTK